MVIHTIEPFLDTFDRMRGRTLRVWACVPEDHVEWRPAPGRFSFGDVLRHLVGMERHLYVDVARGRPPAYPGHGEALASGREGVLAYADRLHGEARGLLAGMTPDDLGRRVPGPAGGSMTAWKLLRAMAEHEAHHRGQVYLMLGLLGVPTPPVLGMTAEEVLAVSGESAPPT